MKIMKEEKLIEIPAKKIFTIFRKYRNQFHIEIICPYCHEITFINQSL